MYTHILIYTHTYIYIYVHMYYIIIISTVMISSSINTIINSSTIIVVIVTYDRISKVRSGKVGPEPGSFELVKCSDRLR